MVKHKIEHRVRFADTDGAGTIYLTRYCQWFHDGLVEFLRSRGLSATPRGEFIINKEKRKETIVIGSYSCKIFIPLKYDDVVVTETGVKEMGRKSITFIFKSYNKETKEVAAEGLITAVFMDRETFKSILIPEKIRKVLER